MAALLDPLSWVALFLGISSLVLQGVIIWIALLKNRSGYAWGVLYFFIGPFAGFVAALPPKTLMPARADEPTLVEVVTVEFLLCLGGGACLWLLLQLVGLYG